MNDELPMSGQAILLLTAVGVCLGCLAAAGLGYLLLKLDSKLASRR